MNKDLREMSDEEFDAALFGEHPGDGADDASPEGDDQEAAKADQEEATETEPETDVSKDDDSGDESEDADDDATSEDDDGEDEFADDDDAETRKKRPSRTQRQARRIAAQAQELEQAQARIDYLESQVAKYSVEPEGVAEKDPEPKEDDFPEYADYERAHQRWVIRTENRLSQRELASEAATEELQRAQAQKVQLRTRQFRDRVKDAVATGKMPEYRDRVDKMLSSLDSSGVELSEHVIDEIQSSQKGPEILYWLSSQTDDHGSNPVLDKLIGSDERTAARMIGRLEARFEQTSRPRKSQAPKPKETPKGGGSRPAPEPENMSDAEFDKHLGY